MGFHRKLENSDRSWSGNWFQFFHGLKMNGLIFSTQAQLRAGIFFTIPLHKSNYAPNFVSQTGSFTNFVPEKKSKTSV
jgi:hypothetical protein